MSKSGIQEQAHLIFTTGKMIRNHVMRILTDHAAQEGCFDISGPQLFALLVLRDRGPATITELSHVLEVSPPSASAMVDRLVEKGILTREHSREDRRKVVVFQPHRYSRTKALFEEFARSFYESDLLIILPIYAAGEERIESIGGNALCKAIRAHGHKNVVFKNGFKEAVSHIEETVRKNDVVVTLGAGDVYKIGEMFLKT